ncbi:MFS transporter [Pararobbsia alpina]|uniref:MFS transporter n=1 Tax=Pararobbsia alpina TaxID=621374 RepID=UPI0039A67E7A
MALFHANASAPDVADDRAALDNVYRRVAWRIMPILLAAQVMAFLDRVNIGTAKLQMASDLHLSATAYGFGAGVFFIGYFVFEVPSNLLLHKLGARAWIARIMISWGVVSAATMFVHSTNGFYVQRFLLGLTEAGFFPGIILYLTYWFPDHRRGRMTTLFMTATAVSGIVSGPLSAWILHALDGYLSLEGWRWMFLIEAVPAIVIGLVVAVALPAGPNEARWLDASERSLLEREIGSGQSRAAQKHGHTLKALANPAVLSFSAIYFLLLAGLYGVSFWLPTVIQSAGVSSTVTNGWITVVPYASAAVAMNIVARIADRTRQWARAVGLSALVACVAFILSAVYASNLVIAVLTLSVACAGILSALPLFWNLPTARLSGVAAAAGIALINSIGNLAGFVSPFAIGWITDITHHASIGVGVLGVAALIAGVLTLQFDRRQRRLAPTTAD